MRWRSVGNAYVSAKHRRSRLHFKAEDLGCQQWTTEVSFALRSSRWLSGHAWRDGLKKGGMGYAG